MTDLSPPPEELKRIIGADTQEWLIDCGVCPALAENHIVLTGITDAGDAFYFNRPPTWPRSTVMACLGGEGLVWAQRRWRPLRKGQIYLIPPSTHSAYKVVPGHRLQVVWVSFDSTAGQSPITGRAPLLSKGDPRPLKSAVEGLYRECCGQGDGPCMQAWVDVIQRYAARLAGRSHQSRFWAAWENIASDLLRQWTVSDMAALANISGEQFRRICHRQFSQTPMQHLARLRLHRAATLLVSTPKTIETIAQEVGYANRFSFSSAFRREMGESPGTYRKETPASPVKA